MKKGLALAAVSILCGIGIATTIIKVGEYLARPPCPPPPACECPMSTMYL